MFELLEQFDYRQTFATWWAALNDPWQFVTPAFHPTPEQFAAAMEFYARIFVIVMAILLMIVLASGRKGGGYRFKMLGFGLLGLATFALTAVAMYLSFWLFGGDASFSGTCVAYIYAAGPYQPFVAFASWMMTAAIPAELRPAMLNPFTASHAGKAAAEHADTDKFTLFLGLAAFYAVTIWTLILIFRVLRYVHETGFLVSLLAFFMGLMLVGLLSRVIMRLMGSISEAAEQEA
jgi:hypothetical protein